MSFKGMFKLPHTRSIKMTSLKMFKLLFRAQFSFRKSPAYGDVIIIPHLSFKWDLSELDPKALVDDKFCLTLGWLFFYVQIAYSK
jgi:hypothetical protein